MNIVALWGLRKMGNDNLVRVKVMLSLEDMADMEIVSCVNRDGCKFGYEDRGVNYCDNYKTACMFKEEGRSYKPKCSKKEFYVRWK